MTTEPVVSQEDREAAATIAALLALKSAEVRGGQWDNHPVIKLLARHRLAALTEARAREAALLSALHQIASKDRTGYGRSALGLIARTTLKEYINDGR